MNTQIVRIGVAVLVVSGMPFAALADSDGHTRSISDVIQGIIVAQGVVGQNEIQCDEVVDAQFEELGDAVMQAMIGDDQSHEIMDQMMGGEGSQSLQQMHIAMGQRYLGCAQGQFGTMGSMGGMMSMMGAGMWGNGGSMMTGYASPWYMAGGSMIFFWLLVIVVFGMLVRWGMNQSGRNGQTALDVLKVQYAKGEIDKTEFDKRKKDLL